MDEKNDASKKLHDHDFISVLTSQNFDLESRVKLLETLVANPDK